MRSTLLSLAMTERSRSTDYRTSFPFSTSTDNYYGSWTIQASYSGRECRHSHKDGVWSMACTSNHCDRSHGAEGNDRTQDRAPEYHSVFLHSDRKLTIPVMGHRTDCTARGPRDRISVSNECWCLRCSWRRKEEREERTKFSGGFDLGSIPESGGDVAVSCVAEQ